MEKFIFSKLDKVWILDLDGTIVVHNGYLGGNDILLEGVKDFFNNLNKNDKIIFLTSRKSKYKEITEKFLQENGIRYDYIIYDLPHGERILVNDNKPSGLKTAYAINNKRDALFNIKYLVDNDL